MEFILGFLVLKNSKIHKKQICCQVLIDKKIGAKLYKQFLVSDLLFKKIEVFQSYKNRDLSFVSLK